MTHKAKQRLSNCLAASKRSLGCLPWAYSTCDEQIVALNTAFKNGSNHCLGASGSSRAPKDEQRLRSMTNGLFKAHMIPGLPFPAFSAFDLSTSRESWSDDTIPFTSGSGFHSHEDPTEMQASLQWPCGLSEALCCLACSKHGMWQNERAYDKTAGPKMDFFTWTSHNLIDHCPVDRQSCGHCPCTQGHLATRDIAAPLSQLRH